MLLVKGETQRNGSAHALHKQRQDGERGRAVGKHRRELTLYLVDGPARREVGDDVIFLELELPGSSMKALVDAGASDCFMSKAAREELPPEQVVDSWQVDRGQIHPADNSNLTI